MNTKGADRSESRQPVRIEIFNYLIFEDSGTGPKVSNFIYNSEDRSQINIYKYVFIFLIWVSTKLSDVHSQPNVGQFTYSPFLAKITSLFYGQIIPFWYKMFNLGLVSNLRIIWDRSGNSGTGPTAMGTGPPPFVFKC